MPEKQVAYTTPVFSCLDDDKLKKLHDASMTILERTGCKVDHPAALDLLKNNGAKVNAEAIACIPRSLVESAVEQAPSGFTVYDRARQPAMHLQGRNVYFGTGSDCQYLLDQDSGKTVDFSLPEVEKAVRMVDGLPHIDFVMSMGLAPELDSADAFQKKYLAMAANTTKPLVLTTGPDVRVLEDIVRMATVIAGDRETLVLHPGFLLLLNPTSPLVHSQEAIEKLIYMADNRLPVVYAPGIMAGATSPVTMAGAIAQANAEILAGLVIHQLTRPGAPFVYGGGMSPMDMKSGQPTYSAPEAMMTQAGLCQMGRDLYQMPTWGFGGCSASKLCDAQAVNEAATYNLMAALSGTNLVHDVGYIESGMTYSLELLVLCNEFIGQVRRMMAGIAVDDEHLALDAIERVGPGGAFLMDTHTMGHFRDNWQPELTDRNTRKIWEKSGGRSMAQRAREKVADLIDTNRPEPLDDDAIQAMEEIIRQAHNR